MSLKNCGTNWTGYDKLHSVILVAVDNWIPPPRHEVSLFHVLRVKILLPATEVQVWRGSSVDSAVTGETPCLSLCCPEQGLPSNIPMWAAVWQFAANYKLHLPFGAVWILVCLIWNHLFVYVQQGSRIKGQPFLLSWTRPGYQWCPVLVIWFCVYSASSTCDELCSFSNTSYALEKGGYCAWQWGSPVTLSKGWY